MDRPWKVISAFVGVFIAGAVFGGFFTLRSVDRVVDAARGKGSPAKAPATKPAPAAPAAPAPAKGIAPQVMRQLTQRLSPTPEQQKAIRPIVSRAAEDLQRMQREHLADTTRTTERMYADVSALLTPAQRTQLEQMRQEMLERVRKVREKRDETPAEGTAKSTPAGTPPAAR
jgi:hypothetical protein